MDATSLKRRRPDESRDEDLYFEDGSVVISAKDADGDLVYFRVHKSVLSKQSTVFKDMFSLPSPPSPASEVDTYDSLPLVHVHDDPKQFKQFLQAIYDPSFLPFLRLGTETPTLVLGPLKLAMKYQADVLQDRITAHLAEGSPTTLDDWDKVAYSPESSEDSEESSPSGRSGNTPDYLTKDFIPDPISFLTLARECDLLVTFSTLLYSLCRESATRKEKLSRMTRADLETLFLGRDRMMRFVSESGAAELEMDSWIPEYCYHYRFRDSSPCSGDCMDEECHTLLFKAWSKILEEVMFYGDPLATFRMTALKNRKYAEDHFDEDHFDEEYQFGGEKYEICVWCKDRLADKLDDLRQRLFDELPSFFPLKDNPQTTGGD